MTGFVDLHIHSYYSDGTMSPKEIAADAKRRGVGIAAVCDHNMLEGSREFGVLCKDMGLGFIPGVEIDSLDGGVVLHHILGLGVDLYYPPFVSFIKRNRVMLDDISVKLIGKMSAALPDISFSDYESFSYDRRLGGWKCLHYLVYKGLAESLQGGLEYYKEYGCPFSVVDFPSIQEVCAQVRSAGGLAVLAHPGETIKRFDKEAFESELERLISLELDGVECYYPTHSEEVTQLCLKLCRKKDLIVTSGSDCHGSFGHTHIGEMGVTADMLNLKGLI